MSSNQYSTDSADRVLLISIDTLRYDCVSFSKNTGEQKHLLKYDLQDKVKTPLLDEIAANSSYFTNCFSTSSYTPPAHASMFTGLYPTRHGIRPFFYKKLSENCVTLAEVFKNNGYKTIFSMDMDIFGAVGLLRGFDYIITGDDKALLDLIESLRGEKIFLFIHFFDVHDPYLYCETPPFPFGKFYNNYNADYYETVGEISRKFCININEKEPHAIWKELSAKTKNDAKAYFPLYVKGVNKFDGGRFKLLYENLKNFGFFSRDALYSILSDHGEGRVSYLDQSIFSHAGELYDEIIHVPMIFHAPGLKDKIRNELASIVDIYPSMIYYAGLNQPGYIDSSGGLYGLDGIKFSEEPPEREFCYSEYFANKIIGYTGDSDAKKDKEGIKDGIVLNKFSPEDEYFLFQRSLRTKNKKFVYYGDFFPTEDFNLNDFIQEFSGKSDEDYVKSLYKKILNRLEDKAGLSAHVAKLKSGGASRLDVLKEFIESPEYGQRLKIISYDLTGDILEENPVFSDGEAAAYIKILNFMEKNAVDAEDIFKDKDEALLIANNTNYTNNKAGLTSSDFAGESASLLKEKISIGIDIIKEAYDRFGDKIGIAYTGGKDSSVLLDLTRKAFNGKIPFKVITIDTSAEFKEIKEFIERIKKEWGFELLTYSNEEALKKNYPIARDKADCCLTLKTAPLKQSVKDLHLKALMTGIRRDETEARADESFFSKRKDPHHYRVHPILHFTEKDIWDYIKLYNLPYCSLYEQGYRSIDCAPCTSKAPREGVAERSGRSDEKEAAMDKLRKLGYF